MKTPQWSARIPDAIKNKLQWISEKDHRNMTDEIIYLIEEHYKKLSLKYQESKDSIDRIEMFLHKHIEVLKSNNSGFIVCYDENQMEFNSKTIIEVLKRQGRNPKEINTEGQTYIEFARMFVDATLRTQYDAFKSIKEELLYSNKVFVIKALSKMKTQKNKTNIARALIKVLDDAHFENIFPKSGLIFIDYAEFLQKSWNDISIYLDILS